MFRKIILLTAIFFMCGAYAQSTEELSSFVKKWREENKIPAAALAIKVPGQKAVYFMDGTTTFNGTTKINKKNLFGVGSITKTFVAATILQLQETHQLNLTDSIGHYFPEYPRWENITILQLLNMTSGIYNFTKSEKFKELIENEPTIYHPPSFFINLAYKNKDEFSPGKGWYYSNTNYYLLEMIIEKVTKKNLLDNFKERLFSPLNLKNTYYPIDVYSQSIHKQQVHAYINDKDVTNENPAYYGPAGCMLMSVDDLLTWSQALFTPNKVLYQYSLNEMMKTVLVPSNPPKPEGSRYGLGIYSLNMPKYGLVWWYTGVVDGYSSVFLWIPKRKIMIVAQIDRWQEGDYGLLMPGREFMDTIVNKIKA